MTPQFKLIPHGLKTLIEITGKMELTIGTNIIQAGSINAPLLATVIESGEGEWQNGVFVPTVFKAGDNVLILDGQGGEVVSHGKHLFLVNENSIIGSY